MPVTLPTLPRGQGWECVSYAPANIGSKSRVISAWTVFSEKTCATAPHDCFLSPESLLTSWSFSLADDFEPIWSRESTRRTSEEMTSSFAQMLAPRNLTSWLQWLQSLPKGHEPIVILHLGYASERFAADPRLPRLLTALEIEGKRDRARFVTDSPILQSRYEAILQQPVTLLPVVVSRHAMASSKRPGNPPCFACLGSAREDKGFPEVLAAIDSLSASTQPINARFALQSSNPDHRSAMALAGFRSAPEKHVSLVDHPLSEEAYLQLLRDADVLLLPYRSETYKERTSGVFCEALSAGKPVIVSEGSLMARQVSRERTGWVVRDRHPESIARVIRRALPELDFVAARCLELMNRYGRMFHPDTVVAKLLSLAERGK